jgi:hypothetical protein
MNDRATHSAINLKTTQGLDVPGSLFAFAGEAIE